jgi:large subunit ribosomal protein L21
MYAIVEIAGHQYKVQKDQQLFVNRLQNDEGNKVSFDEVLLIEDGGKVTVGAPAIDGAQVTAKVVKHLKGDKVIVFKKKRRKGYRKKNGHRQYLTELVIEGIVASGAKKSAAPKKEEPKKEEPVKAAAPAPEAKPAKKAESTGDDLRKVEGIGPKIAEILGESGINTFAELAATDADKIREILEAAGSRYKMFDPTTWPQQAGLAAEGKWDELKELQDKLDGGKA